MPNSDSENTQLLPENSKNPTWRDSVWLKVLAFGTNGLFITSHLLLNGKYLSLLSAEGASASALATTFQSVVIGNGVGFVLGTGLNFGAAFGQKNYIKAGDIGKTATVLTIGIGVISTGSMLLTKSLFPLIFEQTTSKIASDFFLGYAGAATPLLLLITWPQIAFQEGDWYVPPLGMFSVLVSSGIASYLLGFKANLGALGIGIGGTIGNSLSALMVGALLLQKHYKKYHFTNCQIEGFLVKIKELLEAGWKLALQRLSEWGNLFIISTIIGIQSNDALKALNPSILFIVLFGTTLQGFAQAAGMLISKNKGVINEAIEAIKANEEIEANILAIEENHKNNIHTIFRSNLLGIVLNSTVAIAFYFARRPIANFLLSSDSSEELIELSEYLLYLNMISLIPDGLRIIGAGALRGWKDLLYSTILSLILMTLVGIPTAFGLGKLFNNEVEMMIYVRTITITISAIFILNRCHSKIKEDEAGELNQYIKPPSFFKTGFTFFSLTDKQEKKETIDKIVVVEKSQALPIKNTINMG